jgi:hypothetical protein
MGSEIQDASSRETMMQRLVATYVATGLLFMLLPGTFLGVWNLISISGQRSLSTLSPEWLQAHGHAQIFGWIGSFILGIGFYSVSKMARLPSFSTGWSWVSWILWTCGALARWATNLYLWQWQVMLPISAALELTAFLIFFRAVSRHPSSRQSRKVQAWMILAIGRRSAFCSRFRPISALPFGSRSRVKVLRSPMVWTSACLCFRPGDFWFHSSGRSTRGGFRFFWDYPIPSIGGC